jgi:hypothetical protein
VPSEPIAGDEDIESPVVKFHFNCPLLALVSFELSPVCLIFPLNMGHGESASPPDPPEVGLGLSVPTLCPIEAETLVIIIADMNILKPFFRKIGSLL